MGVSGSSTLRPKDLGSERIGSRSLQYRIFLFTTIEILTIWQFFCGPMLFCWNCVTNQRLLHRTFFGQMLCTLCLGLRSEIGKVLFVKYCSLFILHLNFRQYMSMDLPKTYKEVYREISFADPLVLDLHKLGGVNLIISVFTYYFFKVFLSINCFPQLDLRKY